MKTKAKNVTKTERKIQSEPMATRVALHPFLAGMNHTQLTLLTDCAMAAHFKPGQVILREGEVANRFYLIESGEVVLESSEELGRTGHRRNDWSGRFTGLVVDVSAIRLAFHGTRH